MKKMITIVFAIVLLIAFTVPAWAGKCDQSIMLTEKETKKCKGDDDVLLNFWMRFSGGFPSWKNESKNIVLDVMQLVPYGQIQEITTEYINREYGFLADKYTLRRGTEYWYEDGFLNVRLKYCMPRDTVVQLKAFASFGVFQLAVDNPGIPGTINETFNFGPGCGFISLSNTHNDWGITCR